MDFISICVYYTRNLGWRILNIIQNHYSKIAQVLTLLSWIPDMTYHIEHLQELKELQGHILAVKQWC